MERLPDAAVHCWIVPPPVIAAGALQAAAGILTDDERERGARFRFDRDRQLYLGSHVALRLLLSRYTACEPDALPIVPDAIGRPVLGGALSRLRFSLSHSGEMALVALAMDDPVGVDVERVRELPDLIEIARRHFGAGERAAILRLPPDRQPAAFAVTWTRKEAVLKALGLGLHVPLDSFDTGHPDRPARITGDGAARWTAWTVVDLLPGEGYAAAVAIQRTRPTLTIRRCAAPGSSDAPVITI